MTALWDFSELRESAALFSGLLTRRRAAEAVPRAVTPVVSQGARASDTGRATALHADFAASDAATAVSAADAEREPGPSVPTLAAAAIRPVPKVDGVLPLPPPPQVPFVPPVPTAMLRDGAWPPAEAPVPTSAEVSAPTSAEAPLPTTAEPDVASAPLGDRRDKARRFKEDRLMDAIADMCRQAGFDGTVLTDSNGLPLALHNSRIEQDLVGAFTTVLASALERASRMLDSGDVNTLSLDIGLTDKAVLRRFTLREDAYYLLVMCGQSVDVRAEIELSVSRLSTLLAGEGKEV